MICLWNVWLPSDGHSHRRLRNHLRHHHNHLHQSRNHLQWTDWVRMFNTSHVTMVPTLNSDRQISLTFPFFTGVLWNKYYKYTIKRQKLKNENWLKSLSFPVFWVKFPNWKMYSLLSSWCVNNGNAKLVQTSFLLLPGVKVSLW